MELSRLLSMTEACPGCADLLSEHDEDLGCLRERKTVGDDGYEYDVCRCLLGPDDIRRYFSSDAIRERRQQKARRLIARRRQSD